jgi:hypothetical protein
MTGLISAAVVGAVGIGVGAYEANQSQGIAQEGINLATSTANEQGYYNNMLQQLIANPSSVASLPGYQFDLKQGGAAVVDQLGASGFGGSGNEGAALTQFGQGLASSFYGQQTSLLASLSGVTAASSPAQGINAATGASANSASTLSSLLNSLGFESMLGYKASLTGAGAGTPASYSGAMTSGSQANAGDLSTALGGY